MKFLCMYVKIIWKLFLDAISAWKEVFVCSEIEPCNASQYSELIWFQTFLAHTQETQTRVRPLPKHRSLVVTPGDRNSWRNRKLTIFWLLDDNIDGCLPDDQTQPEHSFIDNVRYRWPPRYKLEQLKYIKATQPRELSRTWNEKCTTTLKDPTGRGKLEIEAETTDPPFTGEKKRCLEEV